MMKYRMSDALRTYFTARMEHPDVFGESSCGYEMCCGDRIVITDERTGKHYIEPEKETATKFTHRVQRSIETGRNLFYEEWEPIEIRVDRVY